MMIIPMRETVSRPAARAVRRRRDRSGTAASIATGLAAIDRVLFGGTCVVATI
jgi:hypothetical protein